MPTDPTTFDLDPIASDYEAFSATSHREPVSRPAAVASTGLVRPEWSNVDDAAPVVSNAAFTAGLTGRDIAGIAFDGTKDRA